MEKQAVNARFWVWVCDGWVKLTLRPDQTLSHAMSAPTDEGWESKSTIWTHQGDRVSQYSERASRDCDGLCDSQCETSAPLSALAAIEGSEPDDPCRPDWREIRSSQRDYSAEAAGY